MATKTASPQWHAPFDRFAAIAGRLFPPSLLLLVQRLGIAAVFFMSGRTKVDGLLTVNDTRVRAFPHRLCAAADQAGDRSLCGDV